MRHLKQPRIGNYAGLFSSSPRLVLSHSQPTPNSGQPLVTAIGPETPQRPVTAIGRE